MSLKWKCSTALFITAFSLAGCETNDRLFFATKTNYGLDIDSKPPTAEVTIARRELAIAPTFRDADHDNTLPLLASFGLSGTFIDPEITSRFAGGEAAVFLAEGPEVTHVSSTSSLCLSQEPNLLPFWKKIWLGLTNQEVENTRDFYFATDTSFGLKAAWDGSTGPYPSTVKLGYNRKELAFPPIFAQKVPKKECPDKQHPTGDNEWKVTIPSFIASLNNSSAISSKESGGVTHVQFFATGKAASEFVKRTAVNSALNKAMYPHNDLTITPETTATTVGGTQTFKTAGGKGLVRFTLMHDAATAGTINPSTGEYTAGTTSGKFAVGAADTAGNTAFAVVIVHPQLTLAPTSPRVAHGQTLQFSATGGVPPLNFTLSDNQSGGASIDAKTGLYKAGSTAGNTDKVMVSDSSSPPKSVDTTVTVQ
ncbi:MAG: hypothetical protein H8K03_04470 [Nitrospira sp.]